MASHIAINFRRARQYVDLLDEERKQADMLCQCLEALYQQELSDPLGQPELIKHEVRRAEKLLLRIEKRRGILLELIDDCSATAFDIDEVIERYIRQLRKA